MSRIATAAIVMVAGGAVLMLHGCGGSPPPPPPPSCPGDEIMGRQLCDDDCQVLITCEDGQCTRTPSSGCLVTTPGPCFHHETCEEFRDESATKRECDLMSACCAYNSILIPGDGQQQVIDPICSLATSSICGGDPHLDAKAVVQGRGQQDPPAVNQDCPVFLGDQLCDNGCKVEIRCVDDKCVRYPSADCLVTTPGECFHHETCQEFSTENATRRECDLMSACCAYNSILIPGDGQQAVTDPVCSLAVNAVCGGHPSEAGVVVVV